MRRDLIRLNQEIFACYLQPDYPTNTYLFERRIHVQKNKLVSTMAKWQNLVSHSQDGKNKSIQQFNLLYDIVLSASQLRWRVTDHTTFSVCATELTQLLNAMNQALKEQTFSTEESLEKAIKYFENIYQQVIRIASPEPLVFLLFISDITAYAQVIRGEA